LAFTSYSITISRHQTSIFHSLIIAQKQPTRSQVITNALFAFSYLNGIAEKLAILSGNIEKHLPKRVHRTSS